MGVTPRQFREWAMALFNGLQPVMRDGDLELLFTRDGASLFWNTDSGTGMELALTGEKFDGEPRESDIQAIAKFLRDGDLRQISDTVERGPTDVAGIIRASMSVFSAFESGEVWYRGQPSAQMKLLPGVFRNKGTAAAESDMFTRFVIGARSRHAHCPPDDDQASWIALMQHYGLPTRLLDWSESVLVAVYFAVEDERFDSDPGRVWMLSPGKLNKVSLGLPNQVCYIRATQLRSLLTSAFIRGAEYRDGVAAVSAPEVDLRLLLQHGRFTLHGSPLPLECHAEASQFLRHITIPAVAKRSIRLALDRLGIRASTLFPDLESLACDVRRSYHRKDE